MEKEIKRKIAERKGKNIKNSLDAEPEGIDRKVFGQGVIAKMKQHAPDSVWFLQGWQDNPSREMLKALEKTDVLIGGR